MKKLLKKVWDAIQIAPIFIIGGVVWLVQKSVEAMLGRKY